jgi:hypothetical protein
MVRPNHDAGVDDVLPGVGWVLSSDPFVGGDMLRQLCCTLLLLTSVYAAVVEVPTKNVTVRIQEILEVPQTGEHALSLQEAYFRRRVGGQRGVELEPLVLEFAHAVVGGVKPELLAYPDTVTVKSKVWYADRPEAEARRLAMASVHLERQLLEMAAKAAKEGSDNARTLVRAYLVLLAHDRASFSSGRWQRTVDDVNVFALARLSAEQQTRLDELLDSLEAQKLAGLDFNYITCRILIDLMETPGSQADWDAKLPAFVQAGRDGWAVAPDELNIRYAFCTHAWRLVCLARHHRITGVEESLRPLIDDLKKDTTDPMVLGWLDQILNLPGGPPDHVGVKIVKHPNERKPGRP